MKKILIGLILVLSVSRLYSAFQPSGEQIIMRCYHDSSSTTDKSGDYLNVGLSTGTSATINNYLLGVARSTDIAKLNADVTTNISTNMATLNASISTGMVNMADRITVNVSTNINMLKASISGGLSNLGINITVNASTNTKYLIDNVTVNTSTNSKFISDSITVNASTNTAVIQALLSNIYDRQLNTVISSGVITDSRYVGKVSSGTAGKITAVTGATITIAGNVTHWSFKCKNEINGNYMRIDNTMIGYQCELADGDTDNETVDIPQPITFTLSNLDVGTTIQYQIMKVK